MFDERMSVTEAAKMLGVHPQRLHQRIREGSLPADKIGSQWVLDLDDVRRIRHHAGPGRPLSSRSAWDLLLVAADDQGAAALSPSARSRARMRLNSLLAHVAAAAHDDTSARLAHALRNRAERALFAASPRDLPEIRADQRVHLSGISLPESNMAAGDAVEGYVASDDLDDLVEDHLLSPASRSAANVIFHVVRPGAGSPVLAALDTITRCPLTLAADLAEHDGVREKSQAVRLLADQPERRAAKSGA